MATLEHQEYVIPRTVWTENTLLVSERLVAILDVALLVPLNNWKFTLFHFARLSGAFENKSKMAITENKKDCYRSESFL